MGTRDIQPFVDFIEYTAGGDPDLGSEDIDLTAVYSKGARAIWIEKDGEGDGTISVVTEVGNTRPSTGVQGQGYLHPTPARVTKILAAGTGVTKIRVGF